ncbi:hypothetical protein [Aliikangiella maris]|uniref:Periplasmic protein n=2 Tax=Aliikangiella maris TaxID=3162458 RepID=A0ABV2BZL7_9GAMM
MRKLIYLLLFIFQFSYASGNVDLVQYTQKHIDVVESGKDAIFSFYKSNGLEEKRAILLCLDKYLDPYYKLELSDSDKIFKWLESELSKSSNLRLKEDIFQLLQSYSDLGYDDCEMSDNGNISCNEHNKAKQ